MCLVIERRGDKENPELPVGYRALTAHRSEFMFPGQFQYFFTGSFGYPGIVAEYPGNCAGRNFHDSGKIFNGADCGTHFKTITIPVFADNNDFY
jgi:hypothetical protein